MTQKLKKLLSNLLVVIMIVMMVPVTASAATLQNGSKGTQVKYLQMNLNGLGYGTLDVDSQYGPKTTAAVKKFQKAYSLDVDGIAGSKTLGKMDSVVTSLQKNLKSLGYDPGTADGIFGDNTKAAVKKFQSANGLKATGVADQTTLKKISELSSVIQINGTYTFTTALKKGMVLDVSGNGTANGTNIQIYEANGTKAQIFVVTHLGNGWHKIINQSSSKSIDVAGGKKASGVNVQLYDYNGTDAQMWKFIQAPDGGYYIQNKLGYYLDVSGGKTSNETNVQVYSGNQTASQRWILNKASDTTQSNIITSSYAKTKSNVITYSKKKSGSEKITTNFQIKEFACQDGSDTILIDAKLAALLQDIRNHFGKPVVITSAYRTKTHNKNVGGASNSYHLYGKAADIYISGVSPKEIAKYAESLGVKGIGLYESFVHVDTRTTKYYWNENGRQVSTFR